MGLDSKLELYTTLFGWLFYNSIWEVLVATGIVFLPFIGMVVDTVISAYANEDGEEAANTTLRILEVEFFVAFFVVMMTGVPAVPLSASELSFTPRAVLGTPADIDVSPSDSGSTYGGTISFVDYPNTVDVPVFWYMTMGFTAGFNRAVMDDVPGILDLREYTERLRELHIDDPALQAELNDFFRDCFIEARSRYFDENPSSPVIDTLIERFGVTDTEWVGSHIFLETLGYYDTLRSDATREGFVWSQLRDVEWTVEDHPVYGRPYCNEWWTDETVGLAQKILNETDDIELIAAAVEVGWDEVIRRDEIIKAVMLNSPARWTNRSYDLAYGNVPDFSMGSSDIWDGVVNRTQQAVAGFGLARESISLSAYIRIFLESAPMIQALILMGLYALLPFFVLMSRYKFSVFINGALVLFIVKFWTVLWFFAWWVDQNLIQAFYPEPGNVTTLLNVDMTLKRVLLNVLTGMMYIVFPALFSVYLALSGMGAGRALDGAARTTFSRFSGATKVNVPMPKKGR